MLDHTKQDLDASNVFTTTKGQRNLPRYFAQAFAVISRLERGQLDFVLTDGRVFRAKGRLDGPEAVVQLKNDDVFARLVREGDLGFCEDYVQGGWDTPDLQAFMDLVHADNDELYDSFPGMAIVRFFERLRHRLNSNSKRQARKNISHHYDLGNAFYASWLDETMTYSSALFETNAETLPEAQIAKYRSMVDELGVQSGDHVLEIGCGWGGFAEYAAGQRGLRVTGLTISKEQFNFATKRIEKAGLSHLVDIKMQDYRDEAGLYDGIASIEMFEAVGEKYWPVYFDTLKRCLKPDARATLQIITIQEARYEIYRSSVDFIQKHIFPGGMLPSPNVLRTQIDRADLKFEQSKEFGESYSKTLRLWYETFNDKWDEIEPLGFDAEFRKMWNFYLTSCAATFHSGNCDVTQITMSNPKV